MIETLEEFRMGPQEREPTIAEIQERSARLLAAMQAVPSQDDLTSEYDYCRWRESFCRAYGYYPTAATTLEEFCTREPAREAWERWVERRIRETTYRPDRDGNDRFFFESGFNAAKERTGLASAEEINAEPSARLG